MWDALVAKAKGVAIPVFLKGLGITDEQRVLIDDVIKTVAQDELVQSFYPQSVDSLESAYHHIRDIESFQPSPMLVKAINILRKNSSARLAVASMVEKMIERSKYDTDQVYDVLGKLASSPLIGVPDDAVVTRDELVAGYLLPTVLDYLPNGEPSKESHEQTMILACPECHYIFTRSVNNG